MYRIQFPVKNACSPILVNPFGKVIEVNLWQYANASEPISVTESGITIVVKLRHLQNASLPILVTFRRVIDSIKGQ